MTAYLDSDDLKASLSITGSTFADDDIDLAISSASAMVDKDLGRRFDKRTDTTLLFVPTDPVLLPIDDLIQIDLVRVYDGDAWETITVDEDFRAEPLNAPANDTPWTSLWTIGGYTFPSHREALVEITGTFGWTSPPVAIVQATKILVNQLLIRDRSAPFGVVFGEGVVAYISRHDPQLAGLLSGLSRRNHVRSLQLG